MASASIRVFSPSGSEVHSAVATVDPTGPLTVASVVDPGTSTKGPTVTLDSVLGLSVGGAYWVASSAGWGARVLVSEIVGLTVTFATAPPGDLASLDTITGLALGAPVPGSALSNKSLFWRLEWDMRDAGAVRHRARQGTHVVESPNIHLVDVETVSRYVNRAWPGIASGTDYGYFADLAQRAQDRLQRTLTQHEAYPHTIVDRAALSGAMLAAIRWELALEGYVAGGWDPQEYEQAQSTALKRAVSDALQGQWVDREDSGAVDPANVRSPHNLPMRRL